jgi:hypothetical protein
MVAATLKTSIKTRLTAEGFVLSKGKTDAFINIIVEEILAHIQANALVTVTVASVSGVTVGAGVSGPGTGTGTIT